MTTLVAGLGPSRLGLSGSGEGYERIVKELEAGAGSVPLDAELDVSTKLAEWGFRPVVYSGKGRFNFSRECFYRSGPASHRVGSWMGAEPCRAQFAVPDARTRQHLIGLQVDSPLMTYAAFWGLAHFVLGRQGAGFVHAAIVSGPGGSSCFVGTGGCGKTSTLFTLLEDERYRYQSEDFGIVDRKGRAWYSPKYVSIYASDTRSKLLKEHVEHSLSFRQQKIWQLRNLRGSNPRIKTSPKELVGERVTQTDELARVFYLVRCEASSVELRPLPTAELAERALQVARRELGPWMESLLLIGANDVVEAAFPSVQRAEADLRELYCAAFERAEKHMVIVPKDCSGQDLLAELRRAKAL